MDDNNGSLVPLTPTKNTNPQNSDGEEKDPSVTDPNDSEIPKRSETYWYLQKKLIRKNSVRMILVWICRILPIFAGILAIIYLIYLLSIPENWSTDSQSSQSEIQARERKRETFVSILISFLLAIIGAFMFHIKVKEGLVIINYGFILGPVIRYILNQAIGHDAGLKDVFKPAGFAYAFSSLIGGNFVRYIITIFLDLFISHPIQDVLKRQAKTMGVIEELIIKPEDEGKKPKLLRKYDHFVVTNFPSILQAIIAFVTYNAYTNQTRIAWAYPPETLERALRIPPGTIMISTAVAGVLYLNFYTIMDYISEREYFDVKTKLLYVLTILITLYGLNFTDSIEAPVYGEFDKEYTKSIKEYKPFLGFVVFIGFFLYGFVYPIFTRLGCCGHCKPTARDLEETDHIMEQPEGRQFSEEMITKIRNQIREEVEIAQHESESIETKPNEAIDDKKRISFNAPDQGLMEECLDSAISAMDDDDDDESENNEEEEEEEEEEEDVKEAMKALSPGGGHGNNEESFDEEMIDLVKHIMNSIAEETNERPESNVENRETNVDVAM